MRVLIGPSATRHSIFNQGDSSSGSPGPEFLRHLSMLLIGSTDYTLF